MKKRIIFFISIYIYLNGFVFAEDGDEIILNPLAEQPIHCKLTEVLLEKHNSDPQNLVIKNSLSIKEITTKAKKYVKEELVYVVYPSYSKRMFEKTGKKVYLDDEDLDLTRFELVFLSSKEAYWHITYTMPGPISIDLIMFLDGNIAPYRLQKKVKVKSKGVSNEWR